MSQTFATFDQVPENIKAKIVLMGNHGATDWQRPNQFEEWTTVIPSQQTQYILYYATDLQMRQLANQSFIYDIPVSTILKKLGLETNWVYVEETKQKFAVPSNLIGWLPGGSYGCIDEEGLIHT
jgi:hypothetical protein